MRSHPLDSNHVELRTKTIGFELFSEVEEKTPSVFKSQWWENQLLEWCMKNNTMKTQLLRFVDVFPALRTPRQIVSHLQQYFPRSNREFPAFLRVGIDLSSPAAVTRSLLAQETRSMMTRMAHRFIAGGNVQESLAVLREIRKQGMTFTLDLLGEAVVSEPEADRYMNAYKEALRTLASAWKELEADALAHDGPNISLKLSSLFSQFDPVNEVGSKEVVKRRLREIVRVAREVGAFVYVDMEQYEYGELTLEIFRDLFGEQEFRDFPGAGIVIQAYLRGSENMLLGLLDWVGGRGCPVTVRLVKGAYWDYELINAKQMGWQIPVFTSKAETDANFERLTEILLGHFPSVRTAIGSHNIRSMAHAMACAEALGIEPSQLEFQMLYGMGDPIKSAILKTPYPLRIYTPFGELLPGMAYLVRRMLENTSNESFLRQDFFMGLSPEELLGDPREVISLERGKGVVAPPAKPARKRPGFENEPIVDFSHVESRRRMRNALEEVASRLGQSYPMLIGGERIDTEKTAVSINPSYPHQVVGRVAEASVEHAEDALNRARDAFEAWRQTTAEERAELLLRAADIMQHRRFELAALEVYEVGKTWREADADVAEAIDYLRYYSSEIVRLTADTLTARLPGERNEYVYLPRGVGAVIAPWNFPFAILTGMSSAAIAAGNAVIMKPAPQSPVIAVHLMQIYEEAGIPSGVANLVPGPGKTVGEHLVKSPETDFIAFTGSREVGTRINLLAAEHPSRNGIKKVVAEMGGKNAIIVDESADLDAAVLGVVASAFGYQGQKCSAASRVIVTESVYDVFVPRLVEAARSLRVGPAEEPSTRVGPLIDAEALEKVRGYIERGRREARLLLEVDVSHLTEGFFVGPTIFANVAPGSALAQEEIFGPVLAVLRACDFVEALQIANATQYGLTGGIYSRSPKHIELAKQYFMVGNLYINRKITGAVVQRQPFGGFKMSGIGSKAGGPDYLIQFLLPQTVSENIMRHGFAPIEEL
ncbi:MAG: L-glutamate gamma-semialdehyde dehydrogenase [Candidatus Abyssobacteria bacterium SURF_17]|uniref:L-glutamate gamma-semialdehyde dehydrogenase n=1 Tax=Candidatus Abyssobacteria bacterium SURF_17 TaxID=2093361 RepID=A0A419F687_9BACT|nr:MAG: L-glutamate gamma-semialdehyde dehydrogenase [Candidatus Abyssubacteria bacterium SURF_17]